MLLTSHTLLYYYLRFYVADNFFKQIRLLYKELVAPLYSSCFENVVNNILFVLLVLFLKVG